MTPTSKRRSLFIAFLVIVAAGALAVFMIWFAIGPRRYLEWRHQIHQGQITEEELRQQVGDENYRAYREYVDSIPPLPPATD